MSQNIESELQFFSKQTREPIYDKNLAKKVIHLVELNSGALILDAGCGEGYWGRSFAVCGHRVVGVDLSGEAISRAQKKAVEGQSFFVGNLFEKLSFAKGSFDAIICGGILHHFPDKSDLERVINNLAPCLKDSGKIILVEPNGSNPVVSFSRLLGRFLSKHYSDIATKNETMHPVKAYLGVLKKNNFDILVVESYRHVAIGGGKTNHVIGALVATRRFFLNLVWKILPEPYRGNEVIIIAQLRV